MSDHTPEPWYFTTTKSIERTGFYILHTGGILEQDENNIYVRRPDAWLMEAAPEMLALLQQAIPMLIRLGDFIGNGEPGTRHNTLGQRCDLIGDIRDLFARFDP